MGSILAGVQIFFAVSNVYGFSSLKNFAMWVYFRASSISVGCECLCVCSTYHFSLPEATTYRVKQQDKLIDWDAIHPREIKTQTKSKACNKLQ